MSEFENNDTAQRNLARAVVETVLNIPYDQAIVSVGPLVTNYFSFVFPLNVSDRGRTQKVFVKIPKEDLRSGAKSIFPILPADRRLAQSEIHALQILAAQWHADDLDVSWVSLRGEVPQYNALVTDAVEADDALGMLRRWDLRRRVGSVGARRRLTSVMTRLGTALGRFHQISAKPVVFSIGPSIHKLDNYCLEIATSTRSSVLRKTMEKIHVLSSRHFNAVEVPTFKGIDIRNILMDESDRLFILDPGQLKFTCREADLARFIMTFRILHWGRPLFLLGIRPDPKAEQAFLDAYYAATSPPSPTLLGLFLIKEYLKHWHVALRSLRHFTWPQTVKRLVASLYVNRYYTDSLARELDRVL